MAKVIYKTEVIIDTDDYSVVSSNKGGCEGCPFYKHFTSLVYCYDIFKECFGHSCLNLKVAPSSAAKTITKASVEVDGKVLNEKEFG